MKTVAIDPGTFASGWVVLEGRDVTDAISAAPNIEVLTWLDEHAYQAPIQLALEDMEGRNQRVGNDTYETLKWIGRFDEHWRMMTGSNAILIPRGKVKRHLEAANDSEVRHALMNRYGGGQQAAVGKKADPGPLYGVKGHAWQALAVAVDYARSSGGVGTIGLARSQLFKVTLYESSLGDPLFVHAVAFSLKQVQAVYPGAEVEEVGEVILLAQKKECVECGVPVVNRNSRSVYCSKQCLERRGARQRMKRYRARLALVQANSDSQDQSPSSTASQASC